MREIKQEILPDFGPVSLLIGSKWTYETSNLFRIIDWNRY